MSRMGKALPSLRILDWPRSQTTHTFAGVSCSAICHLATDKTSGVAQTTNCHTTLRTNRLSYPSVYRNNRHAHHHQPRLRRVVRLPRAKGDGRRPPRPPETPLHHYPHQRVVTAHRNHLTYSSPNNRQPRSAMCPSGRCRLGSGEPQKSSAKRLSRGVSFGEHKGVSFDERRRRCHRPT